MNGNLPSIEVQKRFINNNFYNYNKLSRIGFNKKNIYQNCQNYQNLSLHQNSIKLRNNPNFSIDSNIKIWELNNNNTYQNIITIRNYRFICSLLLLKEKNILISIEGERVWRELKITILIY